MSCADGGGREDGVNPYRREGSNSTCHSGKVRGREGCCLKLLPSVGAGRRGGVYSNVFFGITSGSVGNGGRIAGERIMRGEQMGRSNALSNIKKPGRGGKQLKIE